MASNDEGSAAAAHGAGDGGSPEPEIDDDPAFEALLDFIRSRHGFDFRGYKRSSLRRRIEKRLREMKRADFADYQSLLEAEPREYAQLVDTILINVTSFFRDEAAWRSLEERALPEIIAASSPGGVIRVWSAGCATGEEPYSLAILFAEALGIAELQQRVKIYATDLDEAALATARTAVYSRDAVAAVPQPLLEKYFEQTGSSCAFRRDLRKCVIFGRHNILTDAPISRLDLLSCRNLLIYLDVDTQAWVLPRMHHALKEGGYLFLGRAETQIASAKLFEPVDLKSRLFRKRFSSVLPYPEDPETARNMRAITVPRLLEGMLDGAPVALIGVSPKGDLVSVNRAARDLFGIAEADVGRAFHEFQLSYHPVELRSRIDEAIRTRNKVHLEDVEILRSGEPERLRVRVDVIPLYSGNLHVATELAFTETTRLFEVQQQLDTANEVLETTIEELETTNEELQSTNEELETTNEELQSTNEELETTNEELQSTNEELETTNEELRSTNDELEVTNQELRARTEQLERQRLYTEAVLGSIQTGIIVADRQLRVTSWNRWNENVWGLRREQAVGQLLLALDIGLPVLQIAEDLRRVASGGPSARLELAGVDRRGRPIACSVALWPLRNEFDEADGLILFIEGRDDLGGNIQHAGSGGLSGPQ